MRAIELGLGLESTDFGTVTLLGKPNENTFCDAETAGARFSDSEGAWKR